MVGVGGTTAQRTDREDEGLTDAGGGDDNSVVMTKEAKTLMSGIIPNPSGTDVAGAPSVRNGEPTPQDLSDPVSDDDVVTTATPSEDDGINHYKDEESCYDNDNDSNINNELQSLRRQPSIVTTPSQSDFNERCLYEDTFSFLIYSHVCSRTFFLASFVFLFQIAIYIVLAVDISDGSNKKNWFNFPANVETSVRIAEALAIVVAIITQDDVRKAVNLIRDGYNEELANAFPGATKHKWILSILLRGSEGLMGLFVTFLLIMQSDTVIELLLNFLAMEFVSQLDDVVFVLTREGFTGRELQKEARKLSNTHYEVSVSGLDNVNQLSTGSRTASVVTKAYFIILFTIMFALWGTIFARQRKGKYLCSPIFAQFGDEVMPMLGTFTGLYRLHKKPFHGRSSYIDAEKDGGTRVLLAYCKSEKRWTLSLSTAEEKDDPCDWIAASDESTDFDVLTTANSQWVFKTQRMGVLPLSQHFLKCYECGNDSKFCGDGTCDDSGEYPCTCKTGSYGLRCEYSEPCQMLEISQHGATVKTDGRSFAPNYYRFEGARAYNRPVYTSARLDDDQMLSDETDIIAFTGERWILTSKNSFLGWEDNKNVTAYFSQFHGHFTDYSTLYVSEPVQTGSSLDESGCPLGLQWLHSSASGRASDEEFDPRLQPDLQEGPTGTSLFCASCDNTTNPCYHDRAICRSDRTCDCPDGYSGSMCQYTKPCKKLEIDPRENRFPKEGDDYIASKFYRLDGAEANGHPVYTSIGEDQTLSDETDFIVFTGENWILSSKSLFPELNDVNDESELAGYFMKFDRFTEYTALYVSEPHYVDLDSQLAVGATTLPLSVRWQQPDPQKGFVGSSFFCAVCNDSTNPCSYGAVCRLDGTCDNCPNGSSGTMCQIPPKSNGRCDPYFNDITFGFDGGDCCENTCRSTDENTCGKVGQGYIDTGYPFCARSFNQWQLSGDPIYGVSGTSRLGTVVALSGNGKILAVADPGESIVRLFDKDGAEWKPRGQYIQGQPNSNFGAAISLSSNESNNIVRNPRTSPTVTLAVGAPKGGLVHVYTCSTDGCIQRGGDIIGSSRFGSSLSIAEDGNSIAVGNVDRETISQEMTANGEVKVFALTNNAWVKRGSVHLDAPSLSLRKLSDYFSQFHLQDSYVSLSNDHFRLQGYYVSLSNDYLAVGTLKGDILPGPRLVSVKLITQVFQWNKSTDVWEPLGNDIEEKDFYDYDGAWPQKAVVIKRNVLAIGYKSSFDVYSLNETSNAWSKRKIEIALASVPDYFVGWSVDLSEDANILAVGTSVENPLPTDESIQMYKWNGAKYDALFNGVPAGPAASFSLSSDGKAVAVGLPFDFSNGSGGSTRVYNFYPESPCGKNVPVRISFTTDEYPHETSWELIVDSEVKLRSGPLSGHKYTTFVEEICVPVESCMKFILYDTRGDGLNSPGVFALMLDGTEVARGRGGSGSGFFEFYDMMSFGECGCLEDAVPFKLTAYSTLPFTSSLHNEEKGLRTPNFCDAEVSLRQQQLKTAFASWETKYDTLLDCCSANFNWQLELCCEHKVEGAERILTLARPRPQSLSRQPKILYQAQLLPCNLQLQLRTPQQLRLRLLQQFKLQPM